MKLDQEDKEFFQRRTRKETPHSLLAFILASIVVSGSLYVLYQNKHIKPAAQEESPISQVDQSSSAWEQPPQPTYKDQLAYQAKPEPAYVPHPTKPTVYKCKHPDGSIMYSESACSVGAITQIVSVEENVIDSSALRHKANQMRAMAVRDDAQVITVSDVRYMSKEDVWKRIKELEMDFQSITASQEKINASRIERNILMSGKVVQLTFDEENERLGLRRLLNSNDPAIRIKSFEQLNQIFKKYT